MRWRPAWSPVLLLIFILLLLVFLILLLLLIFFGFQSSSGPVPVFLALFPASWGNRFRRFPRKR